MNTDALAQQIASDNKKDKKEEENLLIKNIENDLIGYSRTMWAYFGYTASLTPWHDSFEFPDCLYFKQFKDSILSLIYWLKEEDISFESFAIFSLSIRSPKDFLTPAKLYSGKVSTPKSWIKKLRKHAGTSEDLDLVASVLFRFFELQVEHAGMAEISSNRVIQKDLRSGTGKCMELYHQLIERVLSLKELGIDPILWLETKYDKGLSFSNGNKILFSMIVNRNGIILRSGTYQLKSLTTDNKKKDADYASEYYNLLRDSVKIRLPESHFVVTFLSDGLD